MGKIYRIPNSKIGDFLSPEYQSVLGLLYSFSLLITIAFTLTDLSISGTVALGLLATPILFMLVASLFQSQLPRLISSILAALSVVGFLISLCALAYFFYQFNFGYDEPLCSPEDYCGWELRRWEHISRVRGSIPNNLVELSPLALCTIIYFYALSSQLKVIIRTDGA